MISLCNLSIQFQIEISFIFKPLRVFWDSVFEV